MSVLAFHPDGRPMVAPYSLVTGHMIDLAEPDFAHLSVDALLHAISTGLHNTCRYGGQLITPYSVATHCILGADLVDHAPDGGAFTFFPELRAPLRQRVQLHFLLHDASEGLGLGGVVFPLKQLLRGLYGPLEDLMMAAIYRRLGLEPEPWLEPFVKELDVHMLHDEQNNLRGRMTPFGHRKIYSRHDLQQTSVDSRPGRTWGSEFHHAWHRVHGAFIVETHDAQESP